MINSEELKVLCEYFADKEIPENLEKLVKKLNLIRQINICQDKLDELIKNEK